jgi:cytoskeleton protein RodZ
MEQAGTDKASTATLTGVAPEMASETASETAAPVVPDALPGEVLAAAREQQTLSVDEVAMRLRLVPRQIAALEANDFGALPGMAIVRGFIRSYAKLLGLDPEPLVAMLAHEPNPAFEPIVVRRPLPAPGLRSRRYASPVTHRRGARRLAGFAAVVLVFVGTLSVIAYRNGLLQLPAVDFSLPDIVVGIAQNATAPAQPAASAAADSQQENPQSSSVLAAGGLLELKARQDSWVEVITVNGERKLFSKLIKAGSFEPVEFTEPVILTVGNVAGVDAVLRGQPLDLNAAARENVVRLNLE